MDTDFRQGIVIDNYSYLPKFTVHVYDEYGNHINNEEAFMVQLLGLNNNNDPVEFSLQDGIAKSDLEMKEELVQCKFEGKYLNPGSHTNNLQT